MRMLVALLLLAGSLLGSSVIAAVDRPSAGGSSESRLALVIGNGAYASSPLVNPVNDARAIRNALQEMGFRVILLENATIRQMAEAAREFGDNLQRGGTGLFYYAGHGMQIKGRNYLVPIGADIQREDEVSFNAFDASLLLEKMEAARTRVNIVILDACRNNPFSRSFRSSSQGLAPIEPPLGSYVSFATAPAKVASDGNDGNGLYTQHLLAAMRTPGLKIEEVFKRVRVGVMTDSKGEQIPWDNSSLTGDFYFQLTDAVANAPPAPPTGSSGPATRVVPALSTPPPVTPAQATAANSERSARERQPGAGTAAPAGTLPSGVRADDKIVVAKAAPAAVAKPMPPAQPKVDAAAAEAHARGIAAKQAGDLAAAADAFGRAAEGGHAGAQYEMGLLLKVGRRPVNQDLARSHRLFQQAAEQGNAGAQYELAQSLAQGNGTARNCAQAKKWAQKGADNGSAEAAALAGELNKMDCDGVKDPQQAARLYRIAAEKGLANAQFSLGVLYMNGDGVPRDAQEARKWLTSAASKGNPSARFYLDRLGSN